MKSYKVLLLKHDGTKPIIASGADEKKMRKAFDTLKKSAFQDYEFVDFDTSDDLKPDTNAHDSIASVIARNLVAWDTSKDKREGLLPEVYLTNKVLYKQLTGEEYIQHKAMKKFHIGDEYS